MCSLLGQSCWRFSILAKVHFILKLSLNSTWQKKGRLFCENGNLEENIEAIETCSKKYNTRTIDIKKRLCTLEIISLIILQLSHYCYSAKVFCFCFLFLIGINKTNHSGCISNWSKSFTQKSTWFCCSLTHSWEPLTKESLSLPTHDIFTTSSANDTKIQTKDLAWAFKLRILFVVNHFIDNQP